MFEADLPADKIEDATYIYQMVSLTPTDAPTGPALTIGCVVQVGNPEAVKAFEWEGSSDMSFAGTGAVAMADVATSDLVADSEIAPRDWEDFDFWALRDSELSFRNKVQNCQAELPVEKQGADSGIFTSYTAKLQARLYTSRTDTAPTSLGETEFEITLVAPVQEAEEWDPYDEDWFEDIENIFNIQHEEETTGYVDLGADGTVELKSHLWVDTWVNKEYSRPDVLDFTFVTEGPAEAIPEGALIFSYAQFALTSDTSGVKQTVACITQVGDADAR